MNSIQRSIVDDIVIERERQDRLHGEENVGNSLFKWLAIVQEELGEASESALKNRVSEFRKEMIQVAASAMAVVEDLDQR